MLQSTKKLQDTVDSVSKVKDSLFDSSISLIDAINQKSEQDVIFTLKEKLEDSEEKFEEVIEGEIKQENERLRTLAIESEEKLSNINYSFMVISTVILIGATVLGIFVSHKFPNSIRSLREITSEITKGNLENRVKVNGKDEISDLSSDINLMIESLIDQKKRMQKNERLVAIGELGTRLAHDIKNPLSVIRMSSEYWKLMDGGKHRSEKHFQIIDRAISRISHQVDDVLNFIKKDSLKLEEVQISEVVKNALYSIDIPDKIGIEVSNNDFLITCDRHKLSVAIRNIVLNSIQALSEKGKIKINFEKNDNNTLITIEDSGKGMTSNEIKDIFEPLYTTKQRGTGLGLSSVKSIISAHEGTIKASNNPTTFTITLPNKQKRSMDELS